jgi:hypothetical protein
LYVPEEGYSLAVFTGRTAGAVKCLHNFDDKDNCGGNIAR